MSTIRIPLNSRKYPGLYALIDEADFELVSQYRWHPKRRPTGGFYAATTQRISGEKFNIRIHRLILSPDPSQLVDHINGNSLDNRRRNLRIATAAQNGWNKRSEFVVGESGYRGVSRNRYGWAARVYMFRREIYLGTFTTITAAASAFDDAVKEMRGEFAVTNQDSGLLDSCSYVTPSQREVLRVIRYPSRDLRLTGITHTSSGRWNACYHSNKKRIYIGTFDTAEEAIAARDSRISAVEGE